MTINESTGSDVVSDSTPFDSAVAEKTSCSNTAAPSEARRESGATATVNASPKALLDADWQPTSEHRLCQWCHVRPVEHPLGKWCSKRCRQTAYRFRRIATIEGRDESAKKLAYADPPYPGLSRKYYRSEPSYAGEVDHRDLLERLTTGGYDGWAISTSRDGLPLVLSLIPRGVEFLTCPWVKTHNPPRARGVANITEYVVVVPARRRLPGTPDALVTSVARGGDSSLIGRKPLVFIGWLFRLLGLEPQDSFDDLFPGSGNVTRCFDEFRRVGTVEGTGVL